MSQFIWDSKYKGDDEEFKTRVALCEQLRANNAKAWNGPRKERTPEEKATKKAKRLIRNQQACKELGYNVENEITTKPWLRKMGTESRKAMQKSEAMRKKYGIQAHRPYKKRPEEDFSFE